MEQIEFFCQHCGATLNNQPGFNPDLDSFRCKECGKVSYSTDIYEGERFENVYWFCDSCNALLNSQRGFSDLYNYWKCKQCGFVNSISDENIFEDSFNGKTYNKFCIYCGCELTVGQQFCHICGKKIN